MLVAALVGLGWLVSGYAIARLIGRWMRAGTRREDSLPPRPADRAAWIRGEDVPPSPDITPPPDLDRCTSVPNYNWQMSGLRAVWRD